MRELRAWRVMLEAIGCKNITPFERDVSDVSGIETISNLFSNGFLNSTLNSTIRNDEFENFAENFTYEELMKNLQHKGFRRYANVYSCNSTIATSLTTLVMWIELLLLLRFFSGL
ncbi:hypothetical protein RhiirA4_550232 [Rhizophagus irregularis]|uniref:Uncharacterized protein n=1 Tax=Rhizophagus irregularis TaxID=588596 RepID=A0A2I1HJC6_9GLOM|nr:hypothetical protein RhiirA4_550232 [Rhizophagus irregularis]